METVNLSEKEKSRLENTECTDCEKLPVIYSVDANQSFQEIEYFASCECQYTRNCKTIDTAIDEWIKIY